MSILSMIIFLLVVLSIYAVGHLYVYKTLVNIWMLSTHGHRLLLGVIVVLWLSPFLIGLASRFIPGLFSSMLAQIGYLWMGLLFLFITTHLVLSGVNWVLAHWEVGTTARVVWIAAAGLSLAGVVWGRIDAELLRVRHHEASMPTFDLGQKIRLVQISDTHFGPTLGVGFAGRIIDRIRAQNPDLVVCTGDFLDPGIAEPEELTRLWRELQPPLGKYAVLGNHEAYSGVKWSEKMLTDAGFVVLRNSHAEPVPGLVIAGVDDPAVARMEGGSVQEIDLMRSLPRPSSVILLKHQPRVESRGLFDLQLSGHTHGGQIFPFDRIVSLVFRYLRGRYELPGGGTLIVSAGTGTWGPPIRLFVPPEIVVVDLVAKRTR